MDKPLLPRSKRGELAKRLGERLFAFRREQNLDQEDVAVMVGVAKDRIIAYERGEALPPLYTLLRLSRVLRTTTDALLREELDVPMRNQTVIDIFRELSTLPLGVQLRVARLVGQILTFARGLQRQAR